MQWYEWIFDGVGTAIIGGIAAFIGYKNVTKNINRNTQKAGDNSYQTINYNYNTGMNEEQAQELFNKQSEIVIATCEETAKEVADKRIAEFGATLLPKLYQMEHDFKSFSDPAFQVLLRKAQLSAACSGREDEYKLLSELLVHRIKNKTDKKKNTFITRAVEIVDYIDDDSLNALTLFLAMENFIPVSGDISEGISTIAAFYEKICQQELPDDKLWMDNLSVLGAITTNSFIQIKKFEEYFIERLPGYACVGIEKGSADYNEAVDILIKCEISQSILVDNELMDGYVRLAIPNINEIDTLETRKQMINNGKISIVQAQITEEQKTAIKQVFEMYNKDNMLLNNVKEKMKERIHSYPSIDKAIIWWNSIPCAITITAVGRVIGHTNAKSKYDDLPDLD